MYLATSLRAQTLQVDVANTGHLRKPMSTGGRTGGFGLQNMQERLETLYPNRRTFSLDETDGWVRARLCPAAAD